MSSPLTQDMFQISFMRSGLLNQHPVYALITRDSLKDPWISEVCEALTKLALDSLNTNKDAQPLLQGEGIFE